MKNILVIGCAGQIGTELTLTLRGIYGNDNVIATDLKDAPECIKQSGPFETLDILDRPKMEMLVKKYKIDGIVNMAAILSAVGEEHPMLAWDINMNGLINVLEVARQEGIETVLTPSSIAAFGPETPAYDTPQETILKPKTMYGITKVAGELLGDYYVQKYNMDVRGLRYPGIISHEALPGGGTTDYAVAIFYDAIKYGKYTSFVKADTMLPMMYMPDCLNATIQLFQADKTTLKHHSDFNLAAISFTVEELANEIKKHIPEFEIDYKPDYRQQIADTWPKTIDDSAAREEWGWKPQWDLESMTEDMLKHLKARKEAEVLYR